MCQKFSLYDDLTVKRKYYAVRWDLWDEQAADKGKNHDPFSRNSISKPMATS